MAPTATAPRTPATPPRAWPPFDLSDGVSPTEDRIAADTAAYTTEVIALLRGLLLDVLRTRQPEIEPVLAGDARLPRADPTLLVRALQAHGIWFQLLSIAEQNAGMRRRRLLEAEHGPAGVAGTFAHVLDGWVRAGSDPARLQEILDGLRVRPVITAHPTETKRVTVLELHRRIYLLLVQLESPRWTAREREGLVADVRTEIDLLWLTGELRLEKPTVDQEVAWGLHFFDEALFERVPQLLDRLERELERLGAGQGLELRVPPFFQFGTWIGGDRDGNPFVTNEATRRALFANRLAALQRYRSRLAHLVRRLSVAAHAVDVPAELAVALEAALAASGDAKEIAARNPGEPFRQLAACMLRRVERTLAAAERREAPPARGYPDADALLADLLVLERSLAAVRCAALARELVRPLRREVECFRFRTAALDLRESAAVINATLAAVWRAQAAPAAGAPPPPGSREWRAKLLDDLTRPDLAPVEITELPPQAASTLGLFRLLADARGRIDRDAVGSFVISMTRSAEDVLGAYLLARHAGLFDPAEGAERCAVPFVPLFETVEDLDRAPAVMRELLSYPLVRRTVRGLGGVQEVMIGYSDSNKDGGYLCSNWKLSEVQSRLARVGKECRIPISFFHGRGGSVSRGGAPVGRAVAAQPPGTVAGKLRVTEQGEVVSFKYANRGTAEFQMELLAASVMAHGVGPGADGPQPRPEHAEAMGELSALSYAAYRDLVEHPGLVSYYALASPVEELALLNLGSRPPRRAGARTLDDLRAIPWVFAWTQNRHLVPGWYGVGAALAGYVDRHGRVGQVRLRAMLERCRTFRLVVDEVEKTLAQVDLDVGRAWAELVPDGRTRYEILARVEEEYQRTLDAVLRVTGAEHLLDRFPRFRRRLSRRLPALARIGLEQVRLVRRFRASGGAAPDGELLTPLRLSMSCVAAGLGWTG